MKRPTLPVPLRGAGLLVAFRYQLTTANFVEPTLTTPMNLGFVIGGYSSF